MNKLAIMISLVLLSGCAELLSHRTFVREMDHDDTPYFMANEDFQTVSGDTGKAYRSNKDLMNRTPASYYGKRQYLQRQALEQEFQKLLGRLSPKAMEEFEYYEKHFEDVSEKIYYLRLSKRDQQLYLQSRGITANYKTHNPMALLRGGLYQQREITLGMTKGQVEKVWGRPMRIDVAGNPQQQNERWTFYDQGKMRYVFFERGRVEGWQQ